MNGEPLCGPFVCDYPPAKDYPRGTRWTCPRCVTEYRMSRHKPHRWWRRTFAPNGEWELVHRLVRRR